MKAALRRIKASALAERRDEPQDEVRAFRRRLAEREAEIEAVSFGELRVISGLFTGAPVGDSTASMLKLKSSETLQKVTELALEGLGVYGPADQRQALPRARTRRPPAPPGD